MSLVVEIDEIEVIGVMDVEYSGEDEDELGQATIEVANTAENREWRFGDEVVIRRDGSTEFVGFLEKKPPTGTRDLTREIVARDKRNALHYENVHRVFYEQDRGEVVRKAVNERTQPKSAETLFNGDTIDGWESPDVPGLELADIPSQNLNERGGDLIFLYWRDEDSGRYRIRYTDIDDLGERSLLWLELRYVFNNDGGLFRGEVELSDASNTSYVWDLDIPDGADWVEKRYRAEKAVSEEAEVDEPNTLEFRIRLSGSLPEGRAAALDFARVRRIDIEDRPSEIEAVEETVPNTDTKITRRVDRSILSFVDQLATEAGATSYVDEDDRLHFDEPGEEDTPDDIIYGSTPVVDTDFDRDSTDITNRVFAQGAGDLQVNVEDSSSIDFYGVSPRDTPLFNDNIERRSELEEWAEGYLDANAWDDSAFSFTIGSPEFRSVQIGQSINVEWDPEGINGEFFVSGTETDSAGKVTISFTGSEALL